MNSQVLLSSALLFREERMTRRIYLKASHLYDLGITCDENLPALANDLLMELMIFCFQFSFYRMKRGYDKPNLLMVGPEESRMVEA